MNQLRGCLLGPLNLYFRILKPQLCICIYMYYYLWNNMNNQFPISLFIYNTLSARNSKNSKLKIRPQNPNLSLSAINPLEILIPIVKHSSLFDEPTISYLVRRTVNLHPCSRTDDPISPFDRRSRSQFAIFSLMVHSTQIGG